MDSNDKADVQVLINSLSDVLETVSSLIDFLSAAEANFAKAEKGRLSRRDASVSRGACRTARRTAVELKPDFEDLIAQLKLALLTKGDG